MVNTVSKRMSHFFSLSVFFGSIWDSFWQHARVYFRTFSALFWNSLRMTLRGRFWKVFGLVLEPFGRSFWPSFFARFLHRFWVPFGSPLPPPGWRWAGVAVMRLLTFRPRTTILPCVYQLCRNSCRLVPWRERITTVILPLSDRPSVRNS